MKKPSLIVTKFALIFLFAAMSLTTMLSQEKTKLYPKYTFAVQPLYLINGGLRFDFEQQLQSQKEWLQYSIMGYYYQPKTYDNYYNGYSYFRWEPFYSDFDSFSAFKGVGAGLAYKYFLPRFFYISPGVNYSYFNVAYKEYAFSPYNEDGLTFYEYGYMPFEQNFHKLKSEVTVGIQSTLRKLIFVNVYAGFGYTYSFFDENKAAMNNSIFSFGYRGLTLTAGFRVGITLDRSVKLD